MAADFNRDGNLDLITSAPAMPCFSPRAMEQVSSHQPFQFPAPPVRLLYRPGISTTTGYSTSLLGQFVGNDSQFGSTPRRQMAPYSTITGPVTLQGLLPGRSGWVLSQVFAINYFGQILVSATQPGRAITSLLLTPLVAPGSTAAAPTQRNARRGCESFTINLAKACSPASGLC